MLNNLEQVNIIYRDKIIIYTKKNKIINKSKQQGQSIK